ncbi:ISAs1 family transposase [bacterium]|nr:ISAs1 family transposase [bacterium]
MKSKPSVPEREVLRRVAVRLLREEERARHDELLERHHYLGAERAPGRKLRYVAELDGEWVALCDFGPAALHLKCRERWIGWTPRQRARRLGLVASNVRFLVLPDRGKLPNLASHALGLALRRLSADWEERWGDPLLAVETFVDESLYRGTCYRACGFEALGATAGFGRSARDFYEEHGRAKQLYLKELRPGARALLRRPRLPAELRGHEEDLSGPCPFRAAALGSLLDRFTALRDGRRGHGLRHTQGFALSCAAAAVLMGAGGYQSIADTCAAFTQRQLRALGARRSRDGRFAAPSDSTFYRALSRVDTAAFDAVVGGWLRDQDPSDVERVAVDGKVLRGSGRTDGKPLQLLSAVTHRLRQTLGQVAIAEKSNEIPAFPELVRALPDLGHAVVTADAMHCQQESARVVTRERPWDYVFGLKGNQNGILDRAERLLEKQAFPP